MATNRKQTGTLEVCLQSVGGVSRNSLYLLVIKHGWLENPVGIGVLIGKSPISMVQFPLPCVSLGAPIPCAQRLYVLED